MTRPNPTGDLARTKVHEANESWPSLIEIVAWWGEKGRSGKRCSHEIPADQFFGHTTGAPMTGDQVIGIIERLRRQGPQKPKA